MAVFPEKIFSALVLSFLAEKCITTAKNAEHANIVKMAQIAKSAKEAKKQKCQIKQ